MVALSIGPTLSHATWHPCPLPQHICAANRPAKQHNLLRRRVLSARAAVDKKEDASSTSTLDTSSIVKEKALQILEKEAEIEEKGENFFLYVGSAVAFGAGIYFFQGGVKAEEFFAGYLLEQSLSVDNLFVFILCFNFFKTPAQYQGKVLNLGIITAAVLRLVMILAGVELVDNFKPLLLVFAGILLFSSYKLLFVNGEEKEEDLSNNAIVKTVRKVFTVTDTYRGDSFFVRENGVLMATPLLVALAVIEISDVVFAVDSIPAVFGVTLDPFIIYTSNMFAIVSLRALYGFVSTVISELSGSYGLAKRGYALGTLMVDFAVGSATVCVVVSMLVGYMGNLAFNHNDVPSSALGRAAFLAAAIMFSTRPLPQHTMRAPYGRCKNIISGIFGSLMILWYLDKAVALVLGFIGFKMIADQFGYEVSTTASLAIVATTLGVGTGASLLLPAPVEAKEDADAL